ncbi:MAG: DUF58 domain-containing protein [Lentisphaerae bacterium]|nr:DUF58 domain-containing protein [Lentisphaerota bacterium]
MKAQTGIAAFLTPEARHTLGRLVLQSRYVVEGNLAGAHRSPLRGASSEFADHKAYSRGDDLKHIDWKVLGRTDRYYVKRYEDETNLRVYLAVDRSRSMAYAGDGITKYAYACRLAAALGYVVVKARDSVGLFLHADTIDVKMDARNSFNHLNNLLTHLQEYPPEGLTDIHGTLNRIAASIRKRALVVVISDLLGDEEAITRAFSHFRKQHHDVIVFQVLDPMEMDLSLRRSCCFEDLETGERITADPRGLAAEYERVFGAFLDRYREACAGLGIDYRIVRTDQPVDTFVRAYLEERRRLSK